MENHIIPCYREVMPLMLVTVGATTLHYFLLSDVNTSNTKFMVMYKTIMVVVYREL